MRRILHLTLACLVGGGVSACKPDEVVATENVPTAGVRFINAVPDTAGAFGLDFRWIDLLENNAHYRITFRNGPSAAAPFVSTTAEYKGARAGSRHYRIFYDDTLPTVASSVIDDQTVTLAGNTNYTVMLWGNARSALAADKMHTTFMTDDIGGNTDTTLVGLRVINAGSTAIDVRVYLTGAALPATPTWANVAPYSASTYIFVPASVYNTTTPASSTTYFYNVQPAGGGATLFADSPAMIGTPANCDLHLPCLPGEQKDVPSAPGATVAGSALTGVVYPRSVAAEPNPAAAVAALSAAAGNLSNGNYQYKVTFVTGVGTAGVPNNESAAGTASAVVTVVDKTVAGKIQLTAIPTGSVRVLSRNIYRTKANGTGFLFLANIPDNTTTTLLDNTADTGLGTVGAPGANTTIRTPQAAAFNVPAIAFMWDRRPPLGCAIAHGVPLC